MTRGALALILSLIFPTAPAVAAECILSTVDMRGTGGIARFTVEIADDADERAQGLMFREDLPASSGMLFVYPKPQAVTFWMRNTPVPLDIIFMDETGTVTRIHPDAIPFDETTIPGGDGVRYVLEINAGFAEALGIGEGSVMRHLLVPADVAAWPCDNAEATAAEVSADEAEVAPETTDESSEFIEDLTEDVEDEGDDDGLLFDGDGNPLPQ